MKLGRFSFGIGDRFGSLEVGKSADLVVFSGDPLGELASPEIVFVEGKQITPLRPR